jgi:hypothetical protein
VGHFFEGPLKPNASLNHSRAVWASQVLQVKVPEYIGLIHGVNTRKIESSFMRQGHHLSVFWDSHVNRFLAFCIVYVIEPKQWPVIELPVGPRRILCKQALCTLQNETEEGPIFLEMTPCLGPTLRGSQDG